MKATKTVLHLLGIIAGLGAALVASSCNLADDAGNTKVSATQSTGIPDEVAEEVEALNKRFEADTLSEAGLRVRGDNKGESAQDNSTNNRLASRESSSFAQELTRVQGKYGTWEVLERKGIRFLVCDGVIQGAIPREGVGLSPESLIRSRDYTGLIPFYRPNARSALVIGLGAGIHYQAFTASDMEVHAVDIEPAVVPLAQEYFGFSGTVSITDGRAYVDKTRRRFDAIIIDTFQGGGVPKQLYTVEAFRRMSACLGPNGVLAVHLVAHPKHPAAASVTHTLSEVFEHVKVLGSGQFDELQHIYLIASHQELLLGAADRLKLDACGFTGHEFLKIDTTEASLLTDAASRLDHMCADLAKEHLQLSRTLLRKSP